MKSFGKQAWVELFCQSGLDEAAMRRWHHLFEEQWPIEHQSFLQWLNVPEPEIAQIRASSKKQGA